MEAVNDFTQFVERFAQHEKTEEASYALRPSAQGDIWQARMNEFNKKKQELSEKGFDRDV